MTMVPRAYLPFALCELSLRGLAESQERPQLKKHVRCVRVSDGLQWFGVSSALCDTVRAAETPGTRRAARWRSTSCGHWARRVRTMARLQYSTATLVLSPSVSAALLNDTQHMRHRHCPLLPELIRLNYPNHYNIYRSKLKP